MADRTVLVSPSRAAWRRFQPGSWEATWLHTWVLRGDGWWGEVDHQVNGHAPCRIWVRSADLRPRDPTRPDQLLSRISGEP